MTPEEEHVLWHHKNAARTLIRNFNVLADYLESSALRLVFRNRPDNIFREPPSPLTRILRFGEEESGTISATLQKFQFNARQLTRELPEGWDLPRMIWRCPPGDSAAINMARQFRQAADGLKEKLETLPPDPGLRGWGRRLWNVMTFQP